MKPVFKYILLALTSLSLTFTSAFCQDTLQKEKYIELLRYNKSHEIITKKTIHENRKIRVTYNDSENILKVEGFLRDINDSSIVVEVFDFKDLYYKEHRDSVIYKTIDIKSITLISRKGLLPGPPLLCAGSIISMAGIILMYYGVTDQFFPLIGFTGLGCFLWGSLFCIFGIPMTMVGVIITYSYWDKFDNSKGWVISIKEKKSKNK